MALIELGDRMANWETKRAIEFPWVELKEDKAYLFFLDQALPKRTTEYQYLVVLPEIRSDGETYQTALDCKYFPSLTKLVFSVVIPKTDLFKDPEVRIVLLPKEFKKGSAREKQIEIELSYDDKGLGDISFPFT